VDDRNLKICVGSICGKGSNQGHDIRGSRLLIPQSVNIVETAGALTVLSRETKDAVLEGEWSEWWRTGVVKEREYVNMKMGVPISERWRVGGE